MNEDKNIDKKPSAKKPYEEHGAAKAPAKRRRIEGALGIYAPRTNISFQVPLSAMDTLAAFDAINPD